MVVALRGDHERAQAMAAEVEQAAGGRRLNDLLCCVQLIRGFGLISAGQHTEAYEALARLFDPADPAFHLSDRFHGVMFLAEAAVPAGRVKEARELIAGLEAETAITPAPTLHRQLSYARAVLAEDDEAEELFAEALRTDLTRWPWHRARLELAYGRWLRRQRRVAESRSPLRSAQITFDLIGARSWAKQALSELRAAGERIQAQQPTAQDVLSAQELQIARLAAEGLSNREIGERLYLSPRTVGSHLYRVFPKLEITSRAQLAARLGPAATTSLGCAVIAVRRAPCSAQCGCALRVSSTPGPDGTRRCGATGGAVRRCRGSRALWAASWATWSSCGDSLAHAPGAPGSACSPDSASFRLARESQAAAPRASNVACAERSASRAPAIWRRPSNHDP
jgi:DNA-binding CsgD family transcriptional regulator